MTDAHWEVSSPSCMRLVERNGRLASDKSSLSTLEIKAVLGVTDTSLPSLATDSGREASSSTSTVAPCRPKTRGKPIATSQPVVSC